MATIVLAAGVGVEMDWGWNEGAMGGRWLRRMGGGAEKTRAKRRSYSRLVIPRPKLPPARFGPSPR